MFGDLVGSTELNPVLIDAPPGALNSRGRFELNQT
jgi:hypothetical protein